MTTFDPPASDVWADLDGGTAHNPAKDDIRTWGGTVEAAIAAAEADIADAEADIAALEALPPGILEHLDPVAVATTANITLSGEQTLDTDVTTSASRVLVKDQTDASENGVYVSAAGAWSRATDANSAELIAQKAALVRGGATQGGQSWGTYFAATDTLDTDDMRWVMTADANAMQDQIDAKADAADAALTGDATAENLAVSGTFTAPVVAGLGAREITDATIFDTLLAQIVTLQGQVAALRSSTILTAGIADGTAEAVDVLLVTGQSNAAGDGDSAESPDATATGLYWNGTDFDALADPVGSADTGSAWPAFANAWYARTGRRLVVVEEAEGGTGLLTVAGGDWAPGGTNRGAAVTACNACLTYINGASDYRLGGVYVFYMQGETDAIYVDGTTYTSADYRDALLTLCAYFIANISTAPATVHVAQIGWRGSGGVVGEIRDNYSLGYELVRKAQSDAAESSDDVTLCYEGAFDALPAGLMSDGLHLDQERLNEMGTASAYRMTGTPAPVLTHAPFVAAAEYADTNADAKTTRSVSHTTSATTDGLLIIVSSGRYGGGNMVLTCTVNGVAARTMAKSDFGQSGDGATTTADMSIFFISSDDISGGLWQQDLTIVPTSSANANSLHVAVIETRGVSRAGGANGGWTISSATQEHTINASLPGLCVSAASMIGETDDAFTASISSMTETADIEHSSGSIRSRMVVGYAQVATGDDLTVTTTASAAMDGIAGLSLLMRPVIAGEG